jgi:hypothetical protein
MAIHFTESSSITTCLIRRKSIGIQKKAWQPMPVRVVTDKQRPDAWPK